MIAAASTIVPTNSSLASRASASSLRPRRTNPSKSGVLTAHAIASAPATSHPPCPISHPSTPNSRASPSTASVPAAASDPINSPAPPTLTHNGTPRPPNTDPSARARGRDTGASSAHCASVTTNATPPEHSRYCQSTAIRSRSCRFGGSPHRFPFGPSTVPAAASHSSPNR
jgi:hypothetical protein